MRCSSCAWRITTRRPAGPQSRHHDEGRGGQDARRSPPSRRPRKGSSSRLTAAASLTFPSSPRSTARPKRPSSRSSATSSSTTPKRGPGRPPTSTSQGTSEQSLPGRSCGPGLREKRRSPSPRPARRHPPRRHRCEPRSPVDTRGRHPGVRGRPLRRFALGNPGWPPEEGCRLECGRRLRRRAVGRRHIRLWDAQGQRHLALGACFELRTPVIYDTVHNGDREERVVNQEATLAARDKQAQIKERFRCWVFSEPERTERLVRTYNDTYNNLRPQAL